MGSHKLVESDSSSSYSVREPFRPAGPHLGVGSVRVSVAPSGRAPTPSVTSLQLHLLPPGGEVNGTDPHRPTPDHLIPTVTFGVGVVSGLTDPSLPRGSQ